MKRQRGKTKRGGSEAKQGVVADSEVTRVRTAQLNAYQELRGKAKMQSKVMWLAHGQTV